MKLYYNESGFAHKSLSARGTKSSKRCDLNELEVATLSANSSSTLAIACQNITRHEADKIVYHILQSVTLVNIKLYASI